MSNMCWSCGTLIANELFCLTCHKIQAPVEIDAFQRLHIPHTFDLDLNLLQQKYFQLQNLVHPDRYSQVSDREKRFAQQQAEAINAAYQQLKDPIYRAEILLKRHNQTINAKAQEVLMAMMMWQEKIASAETPEALNALLDQLNKDCTHNYEQLKFEFAIDKIVDAPIFAGTLQYLLKIRQQLMQKMHPQ